MEHLNLSLFAEINAGVNLHGYRLWLAIFAAKYLIFLMTLFLIGMWLWGSRNQRIALLIAFISVLSALLINQLISHIWFHPRPFMLGIGHTYLAHAPDSSFPSDHATVLFTISLVFLLRPRMRILGITMLLLTLWVAWARIYVGVHFPFDMFGSLIVSIISAGIVISQSYFIEHYLFPSVEYIYQKVFSKAIKFKWVKS
ncbi:MAG: undecaprenyl-diphosphatase [Gammaproteobacteria bacterium]